MAVSAFIDDVDQARKDYEAAPELRAELAVLLSSFEGRPKYPLMCGTRRLNGVTVAVWYGGEFGPYGFGFSIMIDEHGNLYKGPFRRPIEKFTRAQVEQLIKQAKWVLTPSDRQ